MKVFSIDIKVAATAYIVAETLEEAREHFAANFAEYMDDELPEGGIVSGESFETLVEFAKDGMGNVSISPAITYYGAWNDPNDPATFELAHDSEEKSE